MSPVSKLTRPRRARRGIFVILGMLALAASGDMRPARAKAPDPLVVDLYFDMAADSLAELDAPADIAPPADSEILIAGVPLRIGTEEGDVGWRSVAGARGRYTVALGHGLSLIGRAQFSNTDFVDAAAADSTVGLAAGELRYAGGGWNVGLQPGLEVTRWANGELQRDMFAEARVTAPLADGLRLAVAAGYRWRELTGVATPHREIAFGRLGLVGNLPHRARLDLALIVRQETASVVTRSTGPTAALVLPLGDTFDLTANYAYTATARAEVTTTPGIPHEDLHHLGVTMRWDIGGEEADADLSAGYVFERPAAPGRDDAPRHTGTVKLALTF